MPKRRITPAEEADLRQALHVAVLEALVASRRWEPGDLVFQGGTSLHLAHGSPRFSEDLDFLVNSSLNIDSIGRSITQRMASVKWIPSDTAVSVSKAKDDRNPHAFVVTIGGENVIGAVRVKVELRQAAKDSIRSLDIAVEPVRVTGGAGTGLQAFVPTSTLHEVYADKVFALVARPYLKPRDVFDLDWISSKAPLLAICTEADLDVRLQQYPNTSTANWLAAASARRQLLLTSAEAIEKDLRNWLPSYWPLNAETVRRMIDTSVVALDAGVAAMQLVDGAGGGSAAPAPGGA